MHQQIRTSPGGTSDNIRNVLDILARAGVNVEGIGPDFEAPHIRTAVPHERWDQAWNALGKAGLKPEERDSLTVAVPNEPGQVSRIVESLVRRGYTLESLLVLASRDRGLTLVSIGVGGTDPATWAETAAELGGWREPAGWIGGDIVEPTAG
jgi:hypothetical protein